MIPVPVHSSIGWGFADENGNLLFGGHYQYAWPFQENGLACVFDGKKCGYVNTKGEEVIPLKFQKAAYFWNEGVAWVEINDLHGFIDEQGNQVIPCMYHLAHYANEKMILVLINGMNGFVNLKNETVIPAIYDCCTYFYDGYSSVELNGRKGKMDVKGNVEWEPDEHIHVTCALILDFENRKVLALRRAHEGSLPGKWELPGGKLEAGETHDECIVREIREELELELKLLKRLSYVETTVNERKIRLFPYKAKISGGQLKLNVHSEFKWLSESELFTVDWAEGDEEILRSYFRLN